MISDKTLTFPNNFTERIMKFQNAKVFAFILSSCLFSVVTVAAEKDKKKSPPPFFVQDPKDSLCLSGDEFRRCSVETLFYVVGEPGERERHDMKMSKHCVVHHSDSHYMLLI